MSVRQRALHFAVHLEQALSIPERDQRTPFKPDSRKAFLWPALPVAFDPDTAPADVLHDLHEVDCFDIDKCCPNRDIPQTELGHGNVCGDYRSNNAARLNPARTAVSPAPGRRL